MKRQITSFLALTALATGMAMAQMGPGGGWAGAPGSGAGRMGMIGGMLGGRLAQALELTDAQKEQAKAIFEQARQSAQPLTEQMQQNRQALAAAVKANDAGQIQQLSIGQGTLHGQLLTIRSQAMAKFYTILTPDQRAKADQLQSRVQQRMQRRLGNRNNG